MSEQKEKLSKLCLTGFILSVLALILLVLNMCFTLKFSSILYWIMNLIILSLTIAGFTLSVIGLITAAVKGRSGKEFGIAGIVIPAVQTILVLILFLVPAGFIPIGLRDSLNSLEQSDHSVSVVESYDKESRMHVGAYVNTEYDVSQYRLRESDLESLNISVSDDELEDYSLNKLTSITTSCHDSYEGRYKKYDFLIIKGEDFEDWLDKQPVGYISYTRYYEDEYICISYPATLEFEGSTICTLDVYKDPSDKFIIITNCGDFKVITEFFESS